jgi:two-component system response regulator
MDAKTRPTVRLPPLGRSESSTSPQTRTEKWFLLVEDSAYDEALLRRALYRQRLASEIVVATDGNEALRCLLGYDASPLPWLVLLDLDLAGLPGVEVLRRLRQNARTRHVPVVVMRRWRDREDLTPFYAAGVNGCIHKPVDPDGFSRMAVHLAGYWLDLNQPPGSRL